MKNISSILQVTTACIGLAIPTMLLAQQPVLRAATPMAADTATTPAAENTQPLASSPAVASTQAGTPAPVKPLLARWIDLSEMSHSQRYRNSYDENGMRLFDNGQQRTVASGRFKFDKDGRYFIGFRASSGRYFNWSYADYAGHDFFHYAVLSLYSFSPAELTAFINAFDADPTGSSLNFVANGWKFYVRDLYVSATPIKQATVEYGSIQIERGYSTEITTFDDDGYIAGERIRIHDPKHLGVDEVSFTNAYLGDITTPNFFDRYDRLTQSNYRQVAAKKLIANRIGASAEYNYIVSTHTMREAAVVKTAESKVIDDVHLELYQRLNTIVYPSLNVSSGGVTIPVPSQTVASANGFAVFVDKKVGRVSGDVGYDSVDPGYGVYDGSRYLETLTFSLNGDTYGTGNRFFTHASVRITPAVSAFGYFTHVVSGNDYTYNKQGINAGLKFDLKSLANTGRRIF